MAEVRSVVALGGNALLERGDRSDAAIQQKHVRVAADAPLAIGRELLICDGDGPQVGMLSLESETDPALSRPYPLDDPLAQTQGMIGYWLTQALRNAEVSTPILSVVTQTLLDHADSAFDTPIKFVSRGYTRRRATELASQHGWDIATDGDLWRRVVASPEPRSIVEQDSITHLVDAGTVVICGGGDGSAVTEDGGRPPRGSGSCCRQRLCCIAPGRHRARSAAAHAHRRRRGHGAFRYLGGHAAGPTRSRRSERDEVSRRVHGTQDRVLPPVRQCHRPPRRDRGTLRPSALFAGTAATTIRSHTNKHNTQHSPV